MLQGMLLKHLQLISLYAWPVLCCQADFGSQHVYHLQLMFNSCQGCFMLGLLTDSVQSVVGSPQSMTASVDNKQYAESVWLPVFSSAVLFCSSEFRGLWSPQEHTWQAP